MKKTIITLLALAGVAGAATTFTEIVSMDDLITETTATVGTSVGTIPGYNQTVYTMNGAYTGLSNSTLTAAMTGDSDYVYVAAWVNISSTSANDYRILFGWGENNTGFKFGIKGDDLCIVTKNQTEKVGGFSIQKDTWTLIAVGFYAGADSDGENMFRIHCTGTDSQMYTYKYDTTPDANKNEMKPMTASTTNTFAIGSSYANKTSEGENFDGLISDLTIFSTSGFASNSEIATALGNAPKLVPEPTTATLSLLALAGLAARRRRK